MSIVFVYSLYVSVSVILSSHVVLYNIFYLCYLLPFVLNYPVGFFVGRSSAFTPMGLLARM